MKDSLGNRMKNNYENRTRYYLPRRTYTIIRIDGKCFHSLTKKCNRPFDEDLIKLMNYTTFELCQNIMGCQFGYVQSDEISLLLTDFNNDQTEAWFDGNIQKITSVSASIATAYFNYKSNICDKINKLAMFDSRVFTISDNVEVENYFIWRQKDATRNSIQMVAQSLYSQKELQGVSTQNLQEKIFQKGINWNNYNAGFKRGRIIVKRDLGYEIENPPIFTENKEYLQDLIPNIR